MDSKAQFIQNARSQGYSDEEINGFLEQKNLEQSVSTQASGMFSNTTPVTAPPQQDKGFRATDLLPIAGGIIGGVGGTFLAPGVGTVVGGGAGAAAGEALRQMLEKEETDAGKIAIEGALGAIPIGKFAKGAKVAKTIVAKKALEKGVLEKGAIAIEEGVRKIRVKPGVGGAQQEKAINETLNRLGLKGSAQKQYENLQPAMNKLEGEIQQIIKANPGVVVVKEDIKKSFLDKLKTSLRSKDLTQKQAQTEVSGYLNDLIKASGGAGKFTNIDLARLRHLKKLVNEDYGAVNDILERGGTLTPRQKVIHVAWSSLDDAVKTASPEMKKVLLDESNLYKAASPLSAARANPPTFRFAGTSVPAGVTQKGRDLAAGALRVPGQIGEKLSAPTIAGEAIRQTLSQSGKRVGANLLGIGQETSGDLSQGQLSTGSVASPTNITSAQQAVNQANENPYPFENYQSDLQRDPKNASFYEKRFKEYQEYYGGEKKPTTVAGQNVQNLAKSGARGLEEARKIYSEDPDILTKQLVPGNFFSRQFDSAITRTVEALLRARSGAAVPETEVKRYMTKFAPTFGDSPEVVRFKFDQLEQDLNDALQGAGNIKDTFSIDQQAAIQAIGL